MKENFINILREATDNQNVYQPNPITNDTPSQTNDSGETKYHYQHKNHTISEPESPSVAEPVNIITPTIEPNGNYENIYKTPQNKKEQNQFIPSKNINQIIEPSPTSLTNCEQILAVWRALFPTIPSGIGQLSNYTPQSCSGKEYNFNFTTVLNQQETARLIREIYLRILRGLDTYSLLIRKESGDYQRQLVLLRTQMQVLSSAMLNVYQDYTVSNVVPLRNSINSCLPNNLKNAYCYLYDEIFYIYNLLSKLIFSLKTDTNFYSQLVTIINNLKYQLSIIFTLYTNTQ